jgi:hypothetical protein
VNDRLRWNEKYREDIKQARVNPALVHFAHLLKPGWVLDLAGGLGQNGAWLAAQSDAFRVIDGDISDEGLSLAPRELGRVVLDAGALPFLPNQFDTVLNLKFYDPRVQFAELLTRGGTVFFETFSENDAKYRPDFNPAHRFLLSEIANFFRGLEILHQSETDDGRRVYVTVIGRKNGQD